MVGVLDGLSREVGYWPRQSWRMLDRMDLVGEGMNTYGKTVLALLERLESTGLFEESKSPTLLARRPKMQQQQQAAKKSLIQAVRVLQQST